MSESRRITPYSRVNASVSRRGHELARREIYPALFGVEEARIVWEDNTLLADGERGAALDGNMAIDRVARVTMPDHTWTIPFTIQERFRRAEYARYRDLTITQDNPNSGKPSELYKLAANLFVYGYLNPRHTGFIEAVACYTPAILMALAAGQIRPRTAKINPRTGQHFLTFRFEDLRARGLIIMHYGPPEEAAPDNITPLFGEQTRRQTA